MLLVNSVEDDITEAQVLCFECREKRAAWCATSPTAQLRSYVKITSGSVRDDTLAGVLDNRRSLLEDWRTLVDTQCRLILRICLDQQHARGGACRVEVVSPTW